MLLECLSLWGVSSGATRVCSHHPELWLWLSSSAGGDALLAHWKVSALLVQLEDALPHPGSALLHSRTGKAKHQSWKSGRINPRVSNCCLLPCESSGMCSAACIEALKLGLGGFLLCLRAQHPINPQGLWVGSASW